MNSTRNIRNIRNAAVAGNAGTGFIYPHPHIPKPPRPPFSLAVGVIIGNPRFCRDI